MHLRDHLALLLLAALWGASFLFLRQASPVVGPIMVAAVRTLGGALVLLPLLMWRGGGLHDFGRVRAHRTTLFGVALLSTLIPFLCLSQAARSLPAGLMSILNATTPLWGALVGWVWTREPMGARRLIGLATGFAGVMLLSAERLQSGEASLLAVALVMLATLCYALSVYMVQRRLHGVPSLTVTTSTLAMAGLTLSGPAWWAGLPGAPDATWSSLSPTVWVALLGLAVLCTGFAYDLFNRLIVRIGASRAISVTFLIPIFGMLWGGLFLGESISVSMVLGTVVILAGTFLSNQSVSSAGSPPSPRPLSFDKETP
jgi:drug/metabolite transporter (DMT)-like permease